MLTLLVFVLVFGGMIFLHEFGHYIVARFFKIPIEEFGFGIPPRVLRLWRGKGQLTIGGQSVTIPSNFDLPFEWQDGLHREAHATADMVNDKLVLRTIKLAHAEPMSAAAQPVMEDNDDLSLKAEYQPSTSAEPVKQATPGAIALHGVLTAVEPGTELTLNALPLGGFVRPRGENNPDVPGGLAAANPWQRLAVLFAGPLMNLLTAVVVFSIIVAQAGMPVAGIVKVEEVVAASPAQQAGLQVNDVIVSINGTPISEIEAARSLIRANIDKPIRFVIERNGEQLTIEATPLSTRLPDQGALGVALGAPTRPATPGEVITGGFTLTGVQSLGMLYLPVGLIQGQISPDEARLIGLKGIYDFFGTAIARDTESRATPAVPTPATGQPTPSVPAQQPTNYVLLLIAMLSVSLGVFNLLPIPALDGGRILFTLPEILFHRRIPPRFENAVNSVAFLALIGLMLFVNAMDFINPVNIPLP